MPKVSIKYKILEEYLGYATLLKIAPQYDVSQAYVGETAREMCLEYARILPHDHPLKKILDSGQSIRRYEWREYKQDILQYFENKYLQNNPKRDLCPSITFWSQLGLRAQNLLSAIFDSADVNPAYHEEFEREVISPLLDMKAEELLSYENLGRRTLLAYANALCAAGYLEKPEDFLAYPGTQTNSGIYQEKTRERSIRNRNRRIMKKFDSGIPPVQIAQEDKLPIEEIARIVEKTHNI